MVEFPGGVSLSIIELSLKEKSVILSPLIVTFKLEEIIFSSLFKEKLLTLLVMLRLISFKIEIKGELML